MVVSLHIKPHKSRIIDFDSFTPHPNGAFGFRLVAKALQISVDAGLDENAQVVQTSGLGLQQGLKLQPGSAELDGCFRARPTADAGVSKSRKWNGLPERRGATGWTPARTIQPLRSTGVSHEKKGLAANR